MLSTSDPSGLLPSLQQLPVLAVLRPASLDQARCLLEQLQHVGLQHVELAVDPSDAWVSMLRQLTTDFPQLSLGAASVRSQRGLAAATAAGVGYAVSPILDQGLLQQARASAITLVPGVFTPTEIALAQRWGAVAVKLFPASCVGAAYWRGLQGPLGPLPFCIAAGGLAPADGMPWLAAGVDAIALGSCLFDHGSATPTLRPGLELLIHQLQSGDNQDLLST